jgi:hypothetical protein
MRIQPKPKQRSQVAAKRGGPAAARASMRVTVHQVMPKGVLSSLNVPARWGWHHRVLVALQSRLLRERGDLQAVAAEPLEPHSLDEADSATDEFDHDLALAQLRHL